jgi:hypothetical protein
MNTQTEHKASGLLNSVWVQMGLLAILAFILIAVAAKYIW